MEEVEENPHKVESFSKCLNNQVQTSTRESLFRCGCSHCIDSELSRVIMSLLGMGWGARSRVCGSISRQVRVLKLMKGQAAHA